MLDERQIGQSRATRLGTVASTYSGGRPQVTFDGETGPSTRTYPYLASYVPAANDRVMLERAGNTWVVIGKVL